MNETIQATRQSWHHGDQRRIARLAKISYGTLNDILRGRANPSKETSIAIENAACQLGIALSAEDVMYPERSFNPLIKACRIGMPEQG